MNDIAAQKRLLKPHQVWLEQITYSLIIIIVSAWIWIHESFPSGHQPSKAQYRFRKCPPLSSTAVVNVLMCTTPDCWNFCREEFKWMEGLQIDVVSPLMLLKLGRSSWFWLSIEELNRSYLTLQVSSDFFNNIFKQDYNIILIVTIKPCFYCRSGYCEEKKYIASSGFADIFRMNIFYLTVNSLQITST